VVLCQVTFTTCFIHNALVVYNINIKIGIYNVVNKQNENIYINHKLEINERLAFVMVKGLVFLLQ